jgi:hypothetical protein
MVFLVVMACTKDKPMPQTTSLDRPEIAKRLFHPRVDPAPSDGRDMTVIAADGTKLALRLHLGDPDWPTLLLFHGNGEVASDYDALAPLLARAGCNLTVAEFRGYGKSEGEPQALTLAGDAAAQLAFLKKHLADAGFSPRLIVMGRSLGSACALSLAAAHPRDFDALVVESGFADTLPLLRTLGVDVAALGLTETDGFNNLRHARSFTGPTLLLHGGEDVLIPPAEAQRLFEALPGTDKHLLVITGAGHNDLLAVGATQYLAALAELPGKLPRP